MQVRFQGVFADGIKNSNAGRLAIDLADKPSQSDLAPAALLTSETKASPSIVIYQKVKAVLTAAVSCFFKK